MAYTTPRWRSIAGRLSILGTGLPLTATFCTAPENTLGIQLLSGAFPTGNLVLLATSQAQTTRWYQEATLEDDKLLVSMEGFSTVAADSPERNWTLSLGQYTGDGLQLHRLQCKELQKQLLHQNTYFHDSRALTAPPVCHFTRADQEWEALPYQHGKNGALSLKVAPVEKRYQSVIACRLSRLEQRGAVLHLAAHCPKSLPQPIGFSLLSINNLEKMDSSVFSPARPQGDFTETHTVCGTLDLAAIPHEPGPFQLSCVLDRAGNTLLHIPLYVTDRNVAVALSEHLEGNPAWDGGDRTFCYLYLDQKHRPLLTWSKNYPGASSFPPEAGIRTLADFLTVADWQGAPAYSARHLGGNKWQWQIRLLSQDLSTAEELSLLLVHDKDHTRHLCPVQAFSGNGRECKLSIDLAPLRQAVESCRRTNWQVILIARQGTTFYATPLSDPSRTPKRNKRQQTIYNCFGDHYNNPIGQALFAGHTVEAIPYCSFQGEWQVTVADQELRYYPHFDCRAICVKLRFGTLHLRVSCPPVEGGTWVGVMLTHRYQLESDRQEYYFPLKQLTRERDHFVLTAQVKLKQLVFSPLYWDIRVVFEKDGVRYLSPIKAPFRSEKRHMLQLFWELGIKGLFFGNSTRLDRDNQLFLYRTVGNRFALVCQEYSPYTGFWFRLKERLAMILYYLFRKQLLNKSIHLIYEKYCCMAQDNGFYFFQYCMEHNMEAVMNRHIYFVIDKKQPDYQNLLPYKDHVISFMSLKHMVYILATRLLISSDSKAHSYAWRAKESLILPQVTKKKRLVFLQHGVIALKRVEFYRSGTNSVNLFVTSNDQEHDIIVKELGYLPKEVVITGLARWYVLKDRSGELPNTHILVMPTWRNWLEEVSDATFIASDYYRNYMALLNSPRLAAYLEQYNVYLDFYIHPKFREYIKNFSISGDRVRLIPFGTQPLNQLMMECKLLVTDYSSVCWDVYYQGKPVLFYQFDLDQYNETQGAYIDMEKDLFGDRATTPDQLFTLLEEAARNDFQLKPKYAAMRNHRYKYIDHNNSQRTCQEIMKRNW